MTPPRLATRGVAITGTPANAARRRRGRCSTTRAARPPPPSNQFAPERRSSRHPRSARPRSTGRGTRVRAARAPLRGVRRRLASSVEAGTTRFPRRDAGRGQLPGTTSARSPARAAMAECAIQRSAAASASAPRRRSGRGPKSARGRLGMQARGAIELAWSSASATASSRHRTCAAARRRTKERRFCATTRCVCRRGPPRVVARQPLVRASSVRWRSAPCSLAGVGPRATQRARRALRRSSEAACRRNWLAPAAAIQWTQEQGRTRRRVARWCSHSAPFVHQPAVRRGIVAGLEVAEARAHSTARAPPGSGAVVRGARATGAPTCGRSLLLRMRTASRSASATSIRRQRRAQPQIDVVQTPSHRARAQRACRRRDGCADAARRSPAPPPALHCRSHRKAGTDRRRAWE